MRCRRSGIWPSGSPSPSASHTLPKSQGLAGLRMAGRCVRTGWVVGKWEMGEGRGACSCERTVLGHWPVSLYSRRGCPSHARAPQVVSVGKDACIWWGCASSNARPAQACKGVHCNTAHPSRDRLMMPAASGISLHPESKTIWVRTACGEYHGRAGSRQMHHAKWPRESVGKKCRHFGGSPSTATRGLVWPQASGASREVGTKSAALIA